jgi:hypothetical protein
MDLRPTNLNENRVALWGRGFRPAAGLPPGVAWDNDAPGETTPPRLFDGVSMDLRPTNFNENRVAL